MIEAEGQPEFVSIFHSLDKQPLTLWEKKIRNGRVRKVRDEDLNSQTLELIGPKPASTYMSCPLDPKQTLGITLPVLNLTMKNLNKMFAFDVQILDNKNVKRRFRASTFQAVAEVKPFTCRLPLSLEEGWNQITFPLQEFTLRCYDTNYVQTLRIQIYSSCRLHRVFFSSKVYSEHELPLEFKLNRLALHKRMTQKLCSQKITNSGLVCILHADNDSPLKLWDKKLRDGKLKRLTDSGMKGFILELTGKVPYINYISCPANEKAQLGIKYPFMVMTVKASERKFFAFDVQILDDSGIRRKFRFGTGQVSFDVQPFNCRMPLILEEDWNNIVVPLHHLTKEVYDTRYSETLRIQIYPSCRIKKLYFADKDYDEEDLPKEFQHENSLFAERYIKKFEDAKMKNSLAPKLHPMKSCKRRDKNEFKIYSVREVIPRVVPVNYALKNHQDGNKSKYPRATYSNL